MSTFKKIDVKGRVGPKSSFYGSYASCCQGLTNRTGDARLREDGFAVWELEDYCILVVTKVCEELLQVTIYIGIVSSIDRPTSKALRAIRTRPGPHEYTRPGFVSPTIAISKSFMRVYSI